MVAKTHSKRRSAQGLTSTLALVRADPPPPSSGLINVVLEYADIQHDAGGGRLVLRLSPKRMKDPVIKSILGREARRLGDISILWDDEGGEIVRVYDAAAGEDAAFDQMEEAMELDTFELTEAALAYIAAYSGRRYQTRN